MTAAIDRAPAAGASRSPRNGITALACLLVAAAILAWTVREVAQAYTAVPFQDQWDNIWWWRDILDRGLTTAYLFSQHNEHRIFFPRLVFLSDLKWFGGRNILNLAAIGIFQFAGAAFFLAAGRSASRGATGYLASAAAASLLFCLVQWQNLVWGFQVQFVAVYAAAAWALYLYSRATAKLDAAGLAALAGAIVLLVFATFNMANGLFAGAVMVLLSLLTRRGALPAVVAAAATAVLVAIYLHGYRPVPGHTPASLALQQPAQYLTYLLVFLGNVWAFGSPKAGLVMGAAGVLLTLAMAVEVVRQGRRIGRAPLALAGVVCFVGVSAAITALGRMTFGIEQALSSRYTTPGCYFWAAQAVFWGLRAVDWSAWPRRAVNAALVLGLVGIVFVQWAALPQVADFRARVLIGASAMFGDVPDQAAELSLYPDPSRVEDLTPFLRAQHLSIFAGDAPPPRGAAFAGPLRPADRCRGSFDLLTARDAKGDVRMASGWGWDTQARRRMGRVLLVTDGRVAGVGLGGVSRHDVSKAIRQVRDSNTGWIGTTATRPDAPMIAYGLLADGSLCELGRKP